jgi:deazaflavin-dependent oxidoreductase (nitroreductase family)
MVTATSSVTSQSMPAWLKRAFALPNWLYAKGAGRVFGHRFVQLTHVGRRSGRTFHTVLEVVRYVPTTGETTVVSGFGPRADWLRNLEAAGRAELDFGRGPRPAAYRILSVDDAVAVYAEYERRNRLIRPIVRSTLSTLLGWTFDGSPTAMRRLAEQLPMVAFRPAAPD